MVTMQDTGELRRIADQEYQRRHHPTDIGLAIITVVVLVAAALWALPLVDADRYSVDRSRWVMSAAAVVSAIAAAIGSAYALDQRNKRRADELMGHIDSLRTAVCGIGRMAAQLEQLDARLAGLAGERQPWPSVDREQLMERLDAAPAAQLHEVAGEAYRLGRRTRRNAEGD